MARAAPLDMAVALCSAWCTEASAAAAGVPHYYGRVGDGFKIRAQCVTLGYCTVWVCIWDVDKQAVVRVPGSDPEEKSSDGLFTWDGIWEEAWGAGEFEVRCVCQGWGHTGKWDDPDVTTAAEYTVGPKVEITASGAYIVPGSTKNRVQYTISPATGFTADSGKVEVLQSGSAVRTIDLTGEQLQGGQRYVEWDGNDSNGSALTSGTYGYRVTLSKGGAECHDDEGGRRVAEVSLAVCFFDPLVAGSASGVNVDTVTETGDKVKISFKVSGVESYANSSYTSVPNGEYDVDANLAETFYVTSPSSPADITYHLKAEVTTGGALDRAENEFDGDPAQTGRQGTVIWEFRILSEESLEIISTEAY